MKHVTIAVVIGVLCAGCLQQPTNPYSDAERLAADVAAAQMVASIVDPSMARAEVAYSRSEPVASVVTYIGGRAARIKLNRDKLIALEREHGRGAAMGIIGHEFGHAIRGDENQEGADWWGGCILRARGLGYRPFLDALASLGVGPNRLAAAYQGWKSCRLNNESTLLIIRSYVEDPNE